jgi:AAA+ ATPase superfamily predicted ATPase
MTDRFLFSVCPEGEFFDRADELGHIMERAAGEVRLPGIYLAGRRWTGKTELLRRAHAGLFWDQAKVVPVYYQFRPNAEPMSLAEDYLKELLKQSLAFLRRDPQVIARSLSLENIEAMLREGPERSLSGFISVHKEARRAGAAQAA